MKKIGLLSPLRWLEVVVLRLAYLVVQALIHIRNSAGIVRRHVFFFTALLISGIVLVTVSAIPVSHYLLGEKLTVNAAVDEAPMGGSSGVAAKKEESIFASLGSLGGEARAQQVGSSEQSAEESALDHAVKHADPNYVCPMHPEIISKNPDDTCPICGMDLVLVEAGGDGGVVTISPETMQALGVRTAPVKQRNIYRRIDTVGYIAENENNIRTVTVRTQGWIERMAVKTVGQSVKKGQLLFEVYSPVLVNAQEEYLQAVQLGNRALISASEDRLRALGVAARQIDEIARTGQVTELVAVYAPQGGYVAELHVREGMQVSPASATLKLVDLSTVWLLVDVFERQADWVKAGLNARATLPFMPDKPWKGQVEYVYPSIDPSTRSVKVRLRFDNADGVFKPNMYADVRIFAQPRKDVLTVPRESIIRTGSEERVIVAMGDGKFIPMPVRTGVETDDLIEIVSGLQQNDEVVVSSQFMIDSEASVKAALMKMGH